MKIRVLFFGATADLVGKRRIEATLSDPMSPDDVVQRLAADYPGLGIRRLLFAVNEQYVPPTTLLKDGDELAIFTAVSGG